MTVYSNAFSFYTDISKLNIFFEQFYFYCFVQDQKKEIAFLYNDIDPTKRILEFDKAPFLRKYIHILGNAKKQQHLCENLEHRLRYEFPKYYQIVCNYLNDNRPKKIIAKYSPPYNLKSLRQKVEYLDLMESQHELLKEYNKTKKIYNCHLHNLDKLRIGLDGKYKAVEKAFELFNGFRKRTNINQLPLIDKEFKILLNQKLELNSHIKILISKWPLFILEKQIISVKEIEEYYSKIPKFVMIEKTNDAIEKRELSGWFKYLYFYQEGSLTSQELILEILNNSGLKKTFSEENIYNGILEMITASLVSYSYLKISV